MVSPQTLKIFWKKFSKTFGKMQFHCIFCKSICEAFKAFRQTFGLPPSLSGTAFGSWEGSHERGAVTQWLRGFAFSSVEKMAGVKISQNSILQKNHSKNFRVIFLICYYVVWTESAILLSLYSFYNSQKHYKSTDI